MMAGVVNSPQQRLTGQGYWLHDSCQRYTYYGQ